LDFVAYSLRVYDHTEISFCFFGRWPAVQRLCFLPGYRDACTIGESADASWIRDECSSAGIFSIN